MYSYSNNNNILIQCMYTEEGLHTMCKKDINVCSITLKMLTFFCWKIKLKQKECGIEKEHGKEKDYCVILNVVKLHWQNSNHKCVQQWL